MNRRTLWERPRLHFEEEHHEHRKVTWLELFFDLFFVVCISQLAHGLSAHPSGTGVLQFLLLFVPLWWVWVGFTIYTDRFESQGLESRVFTFLLMIPIIGLAVFAHQGVGETFVGFALSYALARVVIVFLWARAMVHEPVFRPTGVRFVTGFSIAIALVVAATLTAPPLRFGLFAVALVLDVLTPLTTPAHQARLPRFSTSKLPERFGLFVIIVLGEMIVGIVNGLAGREHASLILFIDAVLGVALGFSVWWLYFDFIGRRLSRPAVWWALAWNYLHLALLMAIVMTGAGISTVIGHDGQLTPSDRVLIASALGATLIVMALLELTLRRANDEPTHRLFSPLLKGVTGLAAAGCGGLDLLDEPARLMLGLLGMLAVNVGYGVWVWARQEGDVAAERGEI